MFPTSTVRFGLRRQTDIVVQVLACLLYCAYELLCSCRGPLARGMITIRVLPYLLPARVVQEDGLLCGVCSPYVSDVIPE